MLAKTANNAENAVLNRLAKKEKKVFVTTLYRRMAKRTL